MTFRMFDVQSKLYWPQSATIRASIKGTTSDFTLDYVVEEDDDALTIIATGILDGTPHEFPTGFVGGCTDPDIRVQFTLVLRPGVQPFP